MGNYRNFTLATYFVAHATARVTPIELEKQLDFILKHLKIDKVYLEPWRGELASHEQVEMIRNAFLRRGIKVSGGLTTVIPTPSGEKPKQRLFNTFCYNDEKMVAALHEAVAFTASHFDEFIIDDFFFTNCTCSKCMAERDAYNQSNGIADGRWDAYRLDLMKRVSEKDILHVAKEANPQCKLIIKYPNWAESYQETGYNPKDQRKQFDMLYTGTETRDPVTTDQHLPRYLSFSLMTYFENMWPEHNGGGWFDNFDMHITEHYLEQAYLTAFSRPKEMMLFCFQSLVNHMYTPALGFQLETLDRLLDFAGNPVGIVCYLPDNAQGEDNLQDFLGMNGLPVVCSPYFPENAPFLLLTRSSAQGENVLEKLKTYLTGGGTAMVTSGFVEALQGCGIEAFTSIRMRNRKVNVNRYRVEARGGQGCIFPFGDASISIPVLEFRNNATWAVVKGAHDEESYGLLLRDDYGDGRMWTLTAPDAFPDLYKLPTDVWSRIRQAFPVRGIWLEGPSRISLFVYDNDTFIIYPYVMENAQRQTVRVHIKGAAGLIVPAETRARRLEPLMVNNQEAVFEIECVPGRYTLFKIER